MVDEVGRRRILVVEDDYMLASDLVDIISTAGAVPIGPIGWEAEALEAVATLGHQLDAAVLDVDLHGVTSYRIADALSARCIPIVFTTGFSAYVLDPAYRHYPRLEKPVCERALLAALHLCP